MPVYKNGIVLSGGGARGFSHLGVLQALNEADIFPDVISGVSAGAIAGVFYADGYKPQEIFRVFNGNRRLDYLSFGLPSGGFMEMTGLEKILERHLSARKFEELKIPLFVTATDINNGKAEYFSKGDLINVIIASSSIPLLFKPIIIDDIEYLDGGIMDNIPIFPLKGICKKIIGSHVNPVGYVARITNMKSIAQRMFHLSISAQAIEKAGQFDLFIDPFELKNFDLFDPSRAAEIYQIGYKETKRKLTRKIRNNLQ